MNDLTIWSRYGDIDNQIHLHCHLNIPFLGIHYQPQVQLGPDSRPYWVHHNLSLGYVRFSSPPSPPLDLSHKTDDCTYRHKSDLQSLTP